MKSLYCILRSRPNCFSWFIHLTNNNGLILHSIVFRLCLTVFSWFWGLGLWPTGAPTAIINLFENLHKIELDTETASLWNTNGFILGQRHIPNRNGKIYVMYTCVRRILLWNWVEFCFKSIVDTIYLLWNYVWKLNREY